MATRNSRNGVPWRLRRGESILSAARAVDATVIKTRLERFERVHQEYAEAHKQFQEAEAQLQTVQARVQKCDTGQQKAVATLAGALLADGQPYGNAFGAFGAAPMSSFTRFQFAKKAKAVHDLVAAVQRDGRLGKATLEAAQAADKAARAVDLALVPYQKMQQGVREARRVRDVRAQAWDTALAVLRRDAHTAAWEGMPQVYAALFPPSRPAPKPKTTPAATSPPATETPAAPTPPATETENAA